jgi:hypothetical protein
VKSGVEGVGSAKNGIIFSSKNNITRDKQTIVRDMEALVTFMKRTILEKRTLLRPKCQFMMVLRTSI